MTIFNDYFEFPKSFPELSTTSIWFVVFCFVVFILSRSFKAKFRPFMLLVANIVFLYSFSLRHLEYVLIISIISYLFSFAISRYRNKYVLLSSIIPFVFVLIYFKYYGLFLNKSLIMPLGLSFYTFKIISYLVDVYNNKQELVINPIYYLDYVMFFPTIIAGPINRAKDFIETLKDKQAFDYKDAKGGAFQMLVGIYEKMVFSDNVGILVTKTLDNPLCNGKGIIFGIILYSFQIYLDFDSYSNIAIGAARLFGFKIPKNFNSPYLAVNLKDFWRRWHISLSSWFRDYVYIPLGGNRLGVKRQYFNLTIVFLLSGLWHGSTLNFAIWGLLHAAIQIVETIVEKAIYGNKKNLLITIIKNTLGVLINFCIVSFLWLIFRYQTMNEVFEVIRRMFVQMDDFFVTGITINELYFIFVVIIVTVILDLFRNKIDMINLFNRLIFPVRWITYIFLIVSFMIFAVYGGSITASDFIYKWF